MILIRYQIDINNISKGKNKMKKMQITKKMIQISFYLEDGNEYFAHFENQQDCNRYMDENEIMEFEEKEITILVQRAAE
jgi:hypothetical protein